MVKNRRSSVLERTLRDHVVSGPEPVVGDGWQIEPAYPGRDYSSRPCDRKGDARDEAGRDTCQSETYVARIAGPACPRRHGLAAERVGRVSVSLVTRVRRPLGPASIVPATVDKIPGQGNLRAPVSPRVTSLCQSHSNCARKGGGRCDAAERHDPSSLGERNGLPRLFHSLYASPAVSHCLIVRATC